MSLTGVDASVLVVTKHTNLDLHGDNLRVAVKNGIVDSQRLSQLEFEHKQHQECIDSVLEFLDKSGVRHTQIHRRDLWPKDPVDLVITVGGDGTFLTACHAKLAGNPVFAGVCSTDESVGYLCGYTRQTFTSIWNDYQAELQKSLPRMKSVVTSLAGAKTETASVINEVLFSSPHPSATLRYRIEARLGSETAEEFHKSSGVWVSTSAGSTAAISASGGTKRPFLVPTMQYAVRERYLRPGESIGIPSVNLFEPSDLKFTNLTEGAILSLDGRRGEYQLGYGDEVCFVWDSPLQVLTQKPEHL